MPVQTEIQPSAPVAANQKKTFWRRLVRQPQQLWIRKALFQVHLWTGIIVGLYIIAIGISGSILVFKEELMPRPRISVPAPDLRACTPEKLLAVVSRVEEAYPDKDAFLTACPQEANPLYMTTLREKRNGPPQRGGEHPWQLSVYSHPSTLQVIGAAEREESWVTWMEELHVNLLLGRSGRLWNGIGAATLLALVLTGMVLWWPGIRAWKRALLLDLQRGWKRINYDLHNVTGFWTLAFTLMWALTGMYFTWPWLFTTPINKVSTIVTASYPAAEMRKLAQWPLKPEVPLDLMAILKESQEISPDGYLEGYFYGSGPKPIFTVYMARARMGDYSNTDFIYFDQRTGEHLYTWHRGKNQTLGDWLVWLVAPLHFGTSWGTGVKWAWFVLGLILPLLTITGFIMYWNRYLSKKLRRLSVVS
jgi:uncharacterized iron-regulated membrane protein